MAVVAMSSRLANCLGGGTVVDCWWDAERGRVMLKIEETAPLLGLMDFSALRAPIAREPEPPPSEEAA